LSIRHRDLAGKDAPSLARDEVRHRVPLQRLREEVALAEHATQLPQPLELGRCRDPLGDRRQAERTPDLEAGCQP
jgi:hypothetical protein